MPLNHTTQNGQDVQFYMYYDAHTKINFDKNGKFPSLQLFKLMTTHFFYVNLSVWAGS